VLVHGDVHQLNALQHDGGFKLIDPDGLLAEAEYDLGVLMRGDPGELLGGAPVDQAPWLAARTGLDLAPYGSGALSSGCRPDCSVPGSTYSP
jgi:streptomycin 6-kinase